jgi:uncharacterized protein (DUF1697 family)
VGRTYVVLIRGINVGRARRVAMADLRSLLEALGYRDVRTLLNSGNVVVTGDRKGHAEVASEIEGAMRRRLGVSTRVVVLTQAEFTSVVEENSLTAVASDPARLLVAFCPDTGRLEAVRPLARQDWGASKLAVGRRAAYVWCAEGILASELLAAVVRTLGKGATTRNWATVTRIHGALRPAPKAIDGRRGGRVTRAR